MERNGKAPVGNGVNAVAGLWIIISGGQSLAQHQGMVLEEAMMRGAEQQAVLGLPLGPDWSSSAAYLSVSLMSASRHRGGNPELPQLGRLAAVLG